MRVGRFGMIFVFVIGGKWSLMKKMEVSMNDKEKNMKSYFVLSAVFLIFALLVFVSCGRQEAVEEQIQVPSESQEKIQQLEKELTEKEEVITELEEKNAHLESLLPLPREVQKGDSHWEIAYDYLTQEKGLPAEEAANRLSDALLFHPVMVGFKVWNYFSDGNFGSFITQGTASISPGTVMRLEKKAAKEEKMGLENQIAGLQKTKEDLFEKAEKMERSFQAEKKKLDNRISSLEEDLNESGAKVQELETKLNSVYYFADSRRELKDRNKIKGTFLGICGTRIDDVTFADFSNSIDLRETDSITVDASEAGLSQIKKVGILPEHLEEGEDYRVEMSGDRRSARVVLLDKDKFRMARLILYLK